MQYTNTYQSPLGEILLASDETGLTGLWFAGEKYFALNLDKEHTIAPKHSHLFAAIGAAMNAEGEVLSLSDMIHSLSAGIRMDAEALPFSSPSGNCSGRFPMAKRQLTASWQSASHKSGACPECPPRRWVERWATMKFPSSFPATASSAKISHSPVTAAVLMSKNICSHTNSAPISKIYLLATAQGALLDRHNKNFRSCNGT